MGLTFLLEHGRVLDATEPRDKLYGLLGLTNWSCCDLEPPELLRVDYRKPISAVFRDAASLAIIESGTLQSFQFINRTTHEERVSDQETLPSWVPRWYELNEDIKLFVSSVYSFWSPFEMDQSLLHDCVQPDRLLLKGCALDSVSVILSGLCTQIREQSFLTMKPKDPFFLFPHATLTYLQSNGKSHLMAETMYIMTGGTIPELIQDEETFTTMAHDVFTYMSLISRGVEVDPLQFDEQLFVFLEKAFSTCDNQTLFLTAKGQIGLGPQMIQPKDCIAALYGGDLAYILRLAPCASPAVDEERSPERITCRLVGCGYIGESRDGEADEAERKQDEAEKKPTIFEIW